MKKFVCLFACLLTFGSAHAGTIFSQDFESGLTSSESVSAISGGFGLTNSATLGNSTFGIGHTSSYVNGINNPMDIYSLTLDLTGVSNTVFSLDYNVDTEPCCDEWGVAINNIALIPTSGFVTNNAFEAGWTGAGFSGLQSGRGFFDISSFDGNSSVTIQVALAPDGSVTGNGYFIDNILVQGDISTVPEPSTFALMGLGLLGFVATRRKNKK